MEMSNWIFINARRPLMIALSLVAILWGGFVIWSLRTSEVQQRLSFDQLKEIASVALTQKNQMLLESLVQSAQVQLGARSSAICRGEKKLVASGQQIDLCENSQSSFARTIRQNIPGSEDLSLVISFPIIQNAGLQSVVLVALLAIVGTLVLLLFRVRKKFEVDILAPLTSGMLAERALPILEMENVRLALKAARKIETEKAVSIAIFERNRQIAHDIRSPLSALKILKAKLGNGGGSEYDLMGSAIDRIEEMAGDMLKQSQKLPQHHSVDSALDLVVRVFSIQKLKAEQMGLLLSLDSSKGSSKTDSQIFCNFSELERVLNNLLENAYVASRSEQEVKFQVNFSAEHMMISVIDNGTGMAPDLLKQIGLQEVNSTKPSGNGIGLFHAFSTVEAWGGKIQVTSELGIGSSLKVVLPLEKKLA